MNGLHAALVAALIFAALFGRAAFRQPVGDPDGNARARHDYAKNNMLGFGLLLALGVAAVVALMLLGASPARAAQRHSTADRIAMAKCGPDGAVDWDENAAFPPPHCNRDGWNGHAYPASAEAPAAPAAPVSSLPSYDDMIIICRTAFLERMQGKEPKEATARILALPDQAKPAAIIVCAAYEQGQKDLLTVMHANTAPATAI